MGVAESGSETREKSEEEKDEWIRRYGSEEQRNEWTAMCGRTDVLRISLPSKKASPVVLVALSLLIREVRALAHLAEHFL